MKQDKGFTLIELMITVAIVAILATVAYPAYQEQVRSTRRADCTGTLMNLAGAMERYYTTNNNYTGATAAAVLGTAQCPIDGGAATYNLAVASTASTFTLTATRTGAQAGDRCGDLTLTNTGLKGISNATAGLTAQDCW